MRHHVKETDNRDLTTTRLVLDHDCEVEVDPIELFKNTIENAFDPNDDSAIGEDLSDLYAIQNWLNEHIERIQERDQRA